MLAPYVCARLEYRRFGQFPLWALTAQPVVEERLEDLLPVICGRIAPEIDGPQLAAVAVPASVIPGAGDEVVAMGGIVPFHQFVDFLRAVKILLVPPASDMDDRQFDGVQVRRERLAPPKLVVVWMTREIRPGGHL